MKLEKEVDVWTVVQNYLDQEAAGTLTPETEVNKPEFKVYVGYKKDEVSLALGKGEKMIKTYSLRAQKHMKTVRQNSKAKRMNCQDSARRYYRRLIN